MRTSLFAVTMIALAGCASAPQQPLSQDAVSTLKGKSVTVVSRESPTFVAMTAGKGMFALAGVGAAAAAGNKLVKDNQIKDPASDISQSVARELDRRHGMIVQGPSGDVAASDKLRDIVQLAQGSDYALDVVTKGWSYMYDGFKFSDYFVGYSSQLRLIDVKNAKVVSSAQCAYDAKTAGNGPVTRETLLANDAAYIKQELAAATEHCVQTFGTQLF